MSWSTMVIDLKDVGAIWPLVEPMLAPAVARSGGRYDMATLLASIDARRSLLWVVYPEDKVVWAAFTTHVAGYPLKAMLSVDFLGGAGSVEWLPQMVDTISRFAADSGLSGCEMQGRDGWLKLLAPLGWRREKALFEKDISV